MAKNDNYKNNGQDIEEFFNQFDKISNNFEKSSSAANSFEAPRKSVSANEDLESEETSQNVGASRSKRRAAKVQSSAFSRGKEKIKNAFDNATAFIKGKFGSEIEEEDKMTGNNGDKHRKSRNGKGKKHYKLNWKKLIRTCFILGCLMALIIGIYSAVIITRCPKIDPDNIYTMLSENSVLYDSEGNVISTVGASAQNRSIIEYKDLPKNLVDAFIAIEDKTFWDHHGFNIIRIFGAIKEAVLTGGDVKGTSTITQQLARNVYLPDTMSSHSIKRKIIEAYYSVQIEKTLSKEQIIEAYLNTINLGFNSHGVQAASQAYFSKDVNDLNLIECVALASLPKSPSTFALIKRLEKEDVDPDTAVIIYEAGDYTYVYNGEKSVNRREQTLKNMEEQELITSEERQAALSENLLDHIHPNMNSLTTISSYFADYATEEVIKDMMSENNLSYEDAHNMVYNGGLQIYTTMNSNVQKILEQEYSNFSNFPGVTHLSKDSAGNLLGKNGKLLLYNKGNIISADENFYLNTEEYKWLSNGDLMLIKGKRLNFYNTQVAGASDISIEFKSMYYIDTNGKLYTIEGGSILVPQGYKSKDNDGNCIIDADFFKDGQEYFKNTADTNTLYVDSKHYVLKQSVIQPQSAMVITDYKTGGVVAMVGGRNTTGKLLFNRAAANRQPGSSIKPICVYGAALQKSLDALNGGTTPELVMYDKNGQSVNHMYGKYMTAASVVDDSPMVVNGKQWPKNWYNSYRGLYTFRTALQQSVNVCAVRIFQNVGPEYAADYAAKFGISTIVKSGESNDMNAAALALGGMTKGAKPIEMASAYGTFANGGLYVSPTLYTKVTTKRGEVILESTSYTNQACDEGVAFIMTDVLRSVVSEGIAGAASIGNQPVAGKTGTTTDNYDAWFVGFTPQFSAACWIGNDVNIELSQGSTAAAKLWSKVMRQVCAAYPTGSFKAAPSNVVSVTIDTKSGLIPTAESSYDNRGTVRSEYFISGTQPTESDNIHTYVQVCNESGFLATPSCPNHSAKFGIKRPYLVDSAVGDINYEVPHYYCPIHNPNPNAYPISGSGLDPTGKDTVTPIVNPNTTDPSKPSEGGGGENLDPGTSEPTVTDGNNTNQPIPPSPDVPDWLQ